MYIVQSTYIPLEKLSRYRKYYLQHNTHKKNYLEIKSYKISFFVPFRMKTKIKRRKLLNLRKNMEYYYVDRRCMKRHGPLHDNYLYYNIPTYFYTLPKTKKKQKNHIHLLHHKNLTFYVNIHAVPCNVTQHTH